jgi:hypothetical protein
MTQTTVKPYLLSCRNNWMMEEISGSLDSGNFDDSSQNVLEKTWILGATSQSLVIPTPHTQRIVGSTSTRNGDLPAYAS